MLILTPQQIREAENDANNAVLSFETMMENAGKGCADHIVSLYPACKTVILCGKGKNGGDGLVIARHLHNAGFNVTIVNMSKDKSDPLSETVRTRIPQGVVQICAEDENICPQQLFDGAALIIECIFGIGFRGKLPETAERIILAANAAAAGRIAVDLPAGLWDGSSEEDTFFHADETLSMLCLKPVHAFHPLSDLCGKVTVIPIGFGEDDIRNEYKKLHLTTKKAVASMFRKRPYNAHKGTNGNALLVMGCRNMPGAAVMAAKGCLHCGAGLVSLAFPDAAYAAVTPQLSECLLLPMQSDTDGCFANCNAVWFAENCNRFSAIAIGCGLSQADGAEQILLTILENYNGKLLIDADGINLLSRHINLLKTAKAQILITPHPGEMARLTGKTISDINADRENTAIRFAEEYGCVTVLKGANTVIAFPDGTAAINPTGNPSMARGGSGDLLTGIISAFLAQGFSTVNAAVAGVFLHGLCGDIAAARFTEYAATVSRMTDCIPDALSLILKKD